MEWVCKCGNILQNVDLQYRQRKENQHAFTQYPLPYLVCTLLPTCANRRLNTVHVQSRNAAGFFRFSVA